MANLYCMATLTKPTVAVLGLGLIGGSLALKAQSLGYDVRGFSRDPDTRAAANDAGIGTADSQDELLQQLPDHALVVLAAPLEPVLEMLPKVLDQTPESVTVTDVVSVKSPLRDAAARTPHAHRFVGAHPMAGTSESGFHAARVDLLDSARWVLTLDRRTDLTRWAQVAQIVTATTGQITPASSDAHDRSVAWISHLPHILAETLAIGSDWQPALGLGAGSFRDATRVASTRPELVEAIIAGNPHLDATLGNYIEQLMQARELLRTGDVAGLLTDGHQARRRWEQIKDEALDQGQVIVHLDAPDAAERLIAIGTTGGYVVSCTTARATALVFEPEK
ncbi:prephenate dehydrogenase [Antricoccus suffuscus]|uniref:Prephenate dehydrogenase n=1 Tax=Antricoccus suffuscus TaxID=1629062 RepID=A0A2T1A323_9ACTN|nr:prephenate dehydrogenase/arogenate dehydrogenase family protein [Antricoccus suffuscus]PRZ42986.1 prephenate dehydrogenase [Antricoccus suffuscus]